MSATIRTPLPNPAAVKWWAIKSISPIQVVIAYLFRFSHANRNIAPMKTKISAKPNAQSDSASSVVTDHLPPALVSRCWFGARAHSALRVVAAGQPVETGCRLGQTAAHQASEFAAVGWASVTSSWAEHAHPAGLYRQHKPHPANRKQTFAV